MIRTILRVLLLAVAFPVVLPYIFAGIQFHGNWLAALGLGGFFAASYLGVGIGISLCFRKFFAGLTRAKKFIPLWVALFWAVSAGLLKLVATVLPALILVSGWAAAVGGGLVLLVIGIATADPPCKSATSNCSESKKA